MSKKERLDKINILYISQAHGHISKLCDYIPKKFLYYPIFRNNEVEDVNNIHIDEKYMCICEDCVNIASHHVEIKKRDFMYIPTQNSYTETFKYCGLCDEIIQTNVNFFNDLYLEHYLSLTDKELYKYISTPKEIFQIKELLGTKNSNTYQLNMILRNKNNDGIIRPNRLLLFANKIIQMLEKKYKN